MGFGQLKSYHYHLFYLSIIISPFLVQPTHLHLLPAALVSLIQYQRQSGENRCLFQASRVEQTSHFLSFPFNLMQNWSLQTCRSVVPHHRLSFIFQLDYLCTLLHTQMRRIF